ncbi:hypothetical protein ELI15_14220 [Rhizobium ruizarguesonis]|uniref:hypothetical protein n=1 Tax=Rhizobium ruizarguesonis TaxID=2081791 RepID=UPI00102F6408|nr:hypothetical protein [Rhizobium ruizarguesonis]TAW65446.1 hypothetical protein ELI15_14220 [Rhizobium ruizarguesonis]
MEKKNGRPKTFNSELDATTLATHLANGLRRRHIIAETGWSDWQYQTAKEYLSKNPAVEAVAVETKTEPAKAEKPKPVRLTKIPVIDANLEPGKVHRFIITAAQDDTPKFEGFWTSLLTYARALGASLITCGLTYQKGLFEDHAVATASYDKDVTDYLITERIQLTPDLLIVCDANVLPTTANPLAGWQTANRGGHVVVPSTRIALESIARMQDDAPRYAISTGCCTLPSYTPRAAGRKALFHHSYGAVLIEIDVDGEVFFHQLIPDDSGAFQHLDRIVDGEKITNGNRVKAITWGDVHYDQLDPIIAMASWGYCTTQRKVVSTQSIAHCLNAEYEFVHDTLDFRRRNHHGLHDPHERARINATTNSNVEAEVRDAAHFVNSISHDGCRTVVVESNHDAAITKWLKNPECMFDAENAYYWHLLNSVWHREIRAGNDDFNCVHEALRIAGLEDHIDFVGSGESFTILDIEHGLHGDIGVSGSRGTPQQFRRFGRRTSTGHTHSPSIADGAFVAGLAAKLRQGYNKGPTKWAHAHIVLNPNGKRAMILMHSDGRFQAMGDVVQEQQLVAA